MDRYAVCEGDVPPFSCRQSRTTGCVHPRPSHPLWTRISPAIRTHERKGTPSGAKRTSIQSNHRTENIIIRPIPLPCRWRTSDIRLILRIRVQPLGDPRRPPRLLCTGNNQPIPTRPRHALHLSLSDLSTRDRQRTLGRVLVPGDTNGATARDDVVREELLDDFRDGGFEVVSGAFEDEF